MEIALFTRYATIKMQSGQDIYAYLPRGLGLFYFSKTLSLHS